MEKKTGEWESKLDFNPIYEFEKGQVAIGVYQGTRVVEKINSKLHAITIDEIDYDIYGCGSLDKQLEDIAIGTEVKILYSGKKLATVDLGNGSTKRTEVHNFTVYTKKK